MSRDPARCGTISGAVTHRRRGEPVCDDCRAAWNQYQRDNRRNWKRAPRVPLHQQLAEQRQMTEMLATAVRDLLCDTPCRHSNCDTARRALIILEEHT